jgi:hypothetical protein
VGLIRHSRHDISGSASSGRRFGVAGFNFPGYVEGRGMAVLGESLHSRF